MSVTFSAEITAVDVRVFRVTCEDGTILGEFTGRANAQSEANTHGLVCSDSLCRGYGADVDEIETGATPLTVNVSNRNALDILRAFGRCPAIGDAPCGEIDAAELITLIDAALTVGVADNALVTIDGGSSGLGVLDGGMRVVDCGREAGYVSGRLTELRALAIKCLAIGARVYWG